MPLITTLLQLQRLPKFQIGPTGAFHRLILAAFILFMTAPFLACQEKLAIPEFYGTYAVAQGKLVPVYPPPSAGVTTVAVRLRQPKQAIQACQATSANAGVNTSNIPSFPASVQFLVFLQTSGIMSAMTVAQDLKLVSLGFVRNVAIDGCERGTVRGVENAWDPEIGTVDLGVKPVQGQQEMVVAVPRSKLDPGVYLLSGYAPKAGLFGFKFLFAVPPTGDAEKSKCVDLKAEVHFNPFWKEYGDPTEKLEPCTASAGPANSATASVSPVGSSTPASSAGAVPSAGSTPSPGNPSNMSAAGCGNSQACRRSGVNAIQSSNWQEALGDFQSAVNQDPSDGVSWEYLGKAYMALGRNEELQTTWDKAISLGRPIGIGLCHERSFQTCQRGTFWFGAKQITFRDDSNQELFSASPSEVTPKGVTGGDQQMPFAYFTVRVGKKNYSFYPIPWGIECQIYSQVRCPPEGVAQQLAVANYFTQTIPKLASGALAPPPSAAKPTTGPANPVSAPSSSNAGCKQAVEAGYSILLQGHLYKVSKTASSGPDQTYLFFDEKGVQVTDSSLLPQLATVAWTRENVVASADARSGVSRVSAVLGTSKALQTFSGVQDAIARSMVEALEAVVTDGASLSKVVPNLTVGVLSNQLTNAPKTLFVVTAQRGLEMSLNAYKEMDAVPLPPADATVVSAPELIRIKALYFQARTLELPYEALAAKLMPTNASQLTNQAFASAISELIPSIGLSSSDQVTLQRLLDLQKGVANLSATLTALQTYSQNLNLALNLAEANNRQISASAGAAANGCPKLGGQQQPSVQRLPNGDYVLNLPDAQKAAVDAFLLKNATMQLVTSNTANLTPGGRHSVQQQVSELIKSGEMQFPFASWNDFNSDGRMDLALVFISKSVVNSYNWRDWWIVVFEGTSSGTFEPRLVTKFQGGCLDGLTYQKNANSVQFSCFGVASGSFHWNGRTYDVVAMKGD